MTGKKKQKPVKRMPDAPDNLKLSKAEFIAKYEKKKKSKQRQQSIRRNS